MPALDALYDSYCTGLLLVIVYSVATAGYCVWEEWKLRKELDNE